MKISDSLLHTHQHYSDDWLYNTISRLIALINQKKEQLQNESLLEFSIRRTESTTILARYDGYLLISAILAFKNEPNTIK